MKKPSQIKIVIGDTIVNLRQFYQKIGNYCIEEKINCPNFFAGVSLPEDLPYVNFVTEDEKYNAIVLNTNIKRADLFEYAVKAMSSEAYVIDNNGGMFEAFYNDFTDMAEIYRNASTICEWLRIPCPQIIVSKNAPLNGCAYNTESGDKTVWIHIKQKESIKKMYCTLAHELRHAWQHKYYNEKYFKDYKMFDKDSSHDEKVAYYLQPAEIDAYAFSFCFMKTIDPNYPLFTPFDEPVDQICSRAKEIWNELATLGIVK